MTVMDSIAGQKAKSHEDNKGLGPSVIKGEGETSWSLWPQEQAQGGFSSICNIMRVCVKTGRFFSLVTSW